MEKSKMYVGNLSYSMTDADLSELFSTFGTVRSAKIIQDRETNRSKGFGFVEMETVGDAEAAIEALNGKDINGRALTVNEARERPKTDYSGQKKEYGGGRRDFR